jgi:hypothetical protein
MAVRKATATKSSTKVSTKTKQVPSPKGRVAKVSKVESEELAGDKEVTLDRRRQPRREESEVVAAPAKLERRTKVQRRRQIDPTTCERDYSDEEVGFMNAMDEYKRKSGRMFPTCSEVLEVIRGLGYIQLSAAELALVRPSGTSSAESTDYVDPNSIEDEAELEFDTV